MQSQWCASEADLRFQYSRKVTAVENRRERSFNKVPRSLARLLWRLPVPSEEVLTLFHPHYTHTILISRSRPTCTSSTQGRSQLPRIGESGRLIKVLRSLPRLLWRLPFPSEEVLTLFHSTNHLINDQIAFIPTLALPVLEEGHHSCRELG